MRQQILAFFLAQINTVHIICTALLKFIGIRFRSKKALTITFIFSLHLFIIIYFAKLADDIERYLKCTECVKCRHDNHGSTIKSVDHHNLTVIGANFRQPS